MKELEERKYAEYLYFKAKRLFEKGYISQELLDEVIDYGEDLAQFHKKLQAHREEVSSLS